MGKRTSRSAGDELAASAERQGLTLSALARSLGMVPSHLNMIRHGKSIPSLRTAVLLEDNLGIPCRAWIARS